MRFQGNHHFPGAGILPHVETQELATALPSRNFEASSHLLIKHLSYIIGVEDDVVDAQSRGEVPVPGSPCLEYKGLTDVKTMVARIWEIFFRCAGSCTENPAVTLCEGHAQAFFLSSELGLFALHIQSSDSITWGSCTKFHFCNPQEF